MLKKINLQGLIIIILCFVIGCLAVGFALLSMKLKYCLLSTKVSDVVITKVVPGTSTRGSTLAPSFTSNITNSSKTVDLKFSLNAPGDSLIANITIKNRGTGAAKIDNIIEVPDYLNNTTYQAENYPILLSHNDITKKVLKRNEEIVLKVMVRYKDNASALPVKIPYQLSILTSNSN